MKRKRRPQKPKKTTRLPYTGTNYALIGIGIFLAFLGFLLLYVGSISLAPVLLVVGYCVLIPLGLLLKTKDERANSSVGRERLPYKQEVRGSNPLSPNQQQK